MIIVKDKSNNELGILENAYNVSVKRTVNELWQSSFSLPKSDPKNELCSHLNFIDITGDSGRYYGLYRIMPTETKKSESDESITYTCEHVLATLLDDVMDSYFQFTGYNTSQVLQGILDLQETERWVLGQVDFIKYNEYSFENENGLLAPILSIPKAFNEAYEFTFDTTVYPWVLNLIAASDEVKSEIRWGKDMKDFNEVSDPTDIVNFIIPKGVGEGVNQLNIARVNGGLNYLKNDESIAKWGKRTYIWIDKSIENEYTLKDRAQALLDQWKNPKVAFTVDSVDLSILPKYSHERKVLNGVTRIIVDDKEYLARIIGEEFSDISKEYEPKYQINNKVSDIAATQADLERKQQVSETYSQGATNIYSFTYQDNCDSLVPAHITFYTDDDVVNVNTCELSFETKKFRGYNAVGNTILNANTGETTEDDGTGLHSHSFDVPSHSHAVTAKVTEYDIAVTNTTLKVDGNTVAGVELNEDRLDIVPYLSKSGGKVTRGKHEITILPNMPARIEANIILRVFIQSRIGGVY